MTLKRETKAGLVVSCSFLSLLSVVLFNKLRDRGAVAPEVGIDERGEVVQAPPDPVPLESSHSGTVAAAESDRGGIKQIGFVGNPDEIRPLPTALAEQRFPDPGPLPPLPSHEEPDGGSTVAAPSTEALESATREPRSAASETPFPASDKPAVAEPVVESSSAIPVQESPARAVPKPPEPEPRPEPDPAPTPSPTPSVASAPDSPKPDSPKPESAVEPETPKPTWSSDGGSASVQPTSRGWSRIRGLREPAEPEKPPEVSGLKRDPFKLPEPTMEPIAPPPTAPGIQRDATGKVVLPPPPTTEIRPTPPREGEPRPSANLLRPVMSPEPGVAPAPPSLRSPVADDLPDTTVKLGPMASAPGTDQYAQARIANTTGQTGSVAPPLPLMGATPPASQAATPQVDAYDEMTYRCQPQDTFATVSTKFYRTDKYARALQMFNRNHPRATDGVKLDPPMLAGQSVYVPPVRILEKDYAAFVPNLTPVPPLKATPEHPTPVGAASPAIGTLPGQGASPTVPPPAGTVPTALPTAGGNAAGSWSNPLGEKMYVVRSNGERFLEIARRTLGNENRWPEIYKLNQRFNPSYPIPGGTVLKLPADAHVEAADMPR